MGPCMDRPVLLAAFERSSQIAESDFLPVHGQVGCLSLEHVTLSSLCLAVRGLNLLDVLCLAPPPTGGGTGEATPLPPFLKPLLWPHTVLHPRLFGNTELGGCGLPRRHSAGSVYWWLPAVEQAI